MGTRNKHEGHGLSLTRAQHLSQKGVLKRWRKPQGGLALPPVPGRHRRGPQTG